MAERPESTIAPIPPSSSPVLDRFYDYLNQPLRTEDPLKNLLSGIAEFVPGISTELAMRRGDKLGQALSYLDVVGGGALKGSIFLIERKKMLEKALKDLDTDPILKMNPDAGKTLQKQLDDVNKKLADEKATLERYNEATEKVLGGKGITSQLPKRDEIFGPNIPKGERDFRNFSANITIDDIIEVVDRQEKQRRKRGDYTDEELTRMLFGKKPKE
jgi:hypothetical protein